MTNCGFSDWSKIQRRVDYAENKFYRIGSWPATLRLEGWALVNTNHSRDLNWCWSFSDSQSESSAGDQAGEVVVLARWTPDPEAAPRLVLGAGPVRLHRHPLVRAKAGREAETRGRGCWPKFQGNPPTHPGEFDVTLVASPTWIVLVPLLKYCAFF